MLYLLKFLQWLKHGCMVVLLHKIVTNDVKTIIVIIVVITVKVIMVAT